MKGFYLITLVLLFAQCGQNESVKNSEPESSEVIEDSVSIPVEGIKYVEIEPIKITDTSWIYDFQGVQFDAEPSSKISYWNGVDFTVYTLILKGNDTVGLYVGWYPDLQGKLQGALNPKKAEFTCRGDFIKKAQAKSNHYFEEDSILINEDDISWREVTSSSQFKKKAIFGKIVYEVFLEETTLIWVCKPDNREGRLDAVVEYKADSIDIKYHFFANIQSDKEYKKIISLAQQIK